MTVKISLIPVGMAQVPQAAQDNAILAHYLEQSGYEQWMSVERVIFGDNSHVELRLNGSLSDYTQSELDAISNSIVSNINNLQEHPEGWHEVHPDQYARRIGRR